MQCNNGTRPPRFVPNEWVERLSQFGPAPPRAGSALFVWRLSGVLALGTPLLLAGLGVVVAWATYSLLVYGLKTRLCRRVPRVPVFLTLWSVATLLYTISGSSRRQETITHVFEAASTQLTHLRDDLNSILRMSHNISDVESNFRERNQLVPRSCMYKQYTQKFMVSMTNEVDEATTDSFALVDRLNDVFHALPQEIGRVLFQSHLVTIWLGYVPILPMLVEIVGVIAIAMFTCMAYYNPEPDISERANRNLKNYGSKIFPALILLATIQAAVYLHLGILVSDFCLDVDTNVLGIVKTMNFTLDGQKQADLDQMTADIHGTADFYLAGIAPNPAQKIIEELATQVQTFSIVRNATVLIQKVAGTVCPSFHQLQSDETIAGLNHHIKRMREILKPTRIWPYYHKVVHKIACDKFPKHVWELIWFNAIMGLVMLPVLAITADVDLQRMVFFKRNQDGSWKTFVEDTEDDYDEYADEGSSSYSYSEPPMSAPTYTHVSRTTVYADRDDAGKVPKKTFLA